MKIRTFQSLLICVIILVCSSFSSAAQDITGIWRGYFFTDLNDQYKFTLGSDVLARSKLSNNYTFKGTFQITRNNQVIGFLNKRNKLQELRDFAPPLVPITAARYQASRNYPWKWQWTSVLGSRMFLDVLAGNWYNFFPLDPTDQHGFATDVAGSLPIASSSPAPFSPFGWPNFRRKAHSG